MKKLITIARHELKYPYYVTEDGQIWSDFSQKFLSFQKDKNGYLKVTLLSPDGRHRFSVHRLVMENFNPVPNMENLQVNHKDGNKENNCLENLEWVSCKENITHAVNNNLRAKVNGSAKLKPEQVIEIYSRILKGESNVELAKEFGVHPDSIGRIRNKKMWKKLIEENFE